MDEPHIPPHHPDYARWCEVAVEPEMIALHESLYLAGKTERQAANLLLDASRMHESRNEVAQALRKIAGSAIVAGWDADVARRSIECLAAKFVELADNDRSPSVALQ